MQPHEVACCTRLAAAGACADVLARVFGRDVRTIRTLLRQAGVRPPSGTPVPPDWRRGLPPATVEAIGSYVRQLYAREQAAWQRLQQAAVEVTVADFLFPTPEAYAAVLKTAAPAESVLGLARRLGVDLNRVLLAYAEWADAAESRRWQAG